MGPTATGKTALAMQIVERLAAASPATKVSLISVDSALVYRQMNIGTAKPDAAQLARYPHQLIDLIDPADSYSAATFCRDATAAIHTAHAAGQLPLLVGGTMLYFRALEHGLSPLPEANQAVREAIAAEAGVAGWAALHQQLSEVDPLAAARIHPNDPQRLQRALEVYRLTGRPMTALQQQAGPQVPWRIHKIALVPSDRAALYQRINDRFAAMLQAGFIAEVEALQRRGDLHADLPAMRAVGYRQVWRYLEGLCSYEAMLVAGMTESRHLAKRQLTWLRREEGVQRVDPFDEKSVASLLNELVTKRI
ncbi:MAG: tRNA (adenosine(37)-N6)-dimethylallyltransferase MiaA [Gammaproteobacteria bacterium]|nr:tRNA (adenosine(37)-N6)-dimethylallyltransferase MiaA [Gammaproteobacteria bacterium]